MKRQGTVLGVLLVACLVGGLVCSAQETEAPPATKTVKSGTVLDISTDFVINALPASILIDVGSDKFGVDTPEGRAELSNVYIMPNITAGVGLEIEDFYVDIVGGVGIVVNESFRSFLVDVGVTAQYAFTDSFKMGPRLALIYFIDPEWVEGEDLNFDGTWGYMVGLQISMGDRIMYMVSVDLLFASFDVGSDDLSLELDADEVELTGLAAQFGVRGEF